MVIPKDRCVVVYVPEASAKDNVDVASPNNTKNHFLKKIYRLAYFKISKQFWYFLIIGNVRIAVLLCIILLINIFSENSGALLYCFYKHFDFVPEKYLLEVDEVERGEGVLTEVNLSGLVTYSIIGELTYVDYIWRFF